ncbi:TPA: substrate-binding domain-containing protein [Pseudomonas aeruginosa]
MLNYGSKCKVLGLALGAVWLKGVLISAAYAAPVDVTIFGESGAAYAFLGDKEVAPSQPSEPIPTVTEDSSTGSQSVLNAYAKTAEAERRFGADASGVANKLTFYYTPNGRESSIEAIQGNSQGIDLIMTDFPLTVAEYKAFSDNSAARNVRESLIQVPVLAHSIAVIFSNSDLAGQDSVNITTADLARVFAGEITNWKDLTLRNGAGAVITLPSRAITLSVPQWRSGDTFGLFNYLNRRRPVLQNNRYFTVDNLYGPAVSSAQDPSRRPPVIEGRNANDVVINTNTTDGAIGYAVASAAASSRYFFVDGQDPFQGMITPLVLSSNDYVLDQGVNDTNQPATSATRGAWNYSPISNIPEGDAGLMTFVKPEAYPTSRYPIKNISYLITYKAGHGTDDKVQAIKGLVGVFNSGSGYRGQNINDNKYVSTVKDRGYAWLDGVNPRIVAAENAVSR